ncbi:general secretion pathway protein C [Desulfocicer vacuolatum DSM 3385]|uniref:General secretion pathway protein C n=1 Tax=Desulfocicer vacuolatum DSM 3385 TaxID=1121400 RepID=A0A1W1ZF32_9BACT|nr:type II secretion system protein GspC [Desulfocicer vacuolatum]SMC47089.1 general secretion pathway protein C [Desulfocicer vacuolatum DSM 3385]
MKKGFIVIHLLLLSLLAFQGAQMFYGQWNDLFVLPVMSHHVDLSLGDTAKEIKKKKKSRQHYAAIEKRNLFKAALEEKKEVSGPDPEIPLVDTLEKTRLDLKLLGTIVLEPRGAFAIIKEGRKKEQKRYQKGDTVQNALIKAVLREKVILSYKGRDEVLLMEPAKGSGVPAAPLFPSVLSGGKTGEKNTLSRTMVNEALGNINKLMGDVRVRPHFSRGKPDGLLLYGIKKNSLFQNMGLKNGDIIMGVDGKEIESVDDALTFYELLKDASDVNVQIKRRGKTKEIQYHVE